MAYPCGDPTGSPQRVVRTCGAEAGDRRSGAVEAGEEALLGGAPVRQRLVGDPDLLDDPAADPEHALADLAGRDIPVVEADGDDLADP